MKPTSRFTQEDLYNCNNVGAALLHRGEISDAIKILAVALKRAKRNVLRASGPGQAPLLRKVLQAVLSVDIKQNKETLPTHAFVFAMAPNESEEGDSHDPFASTPRCRTAGGHQSDSMPLPLHENAETCCGEDYEDLLKATPIGMLQAGSFVCLKPYFLHDDSDYWHGGVAIDGHHRGALMKVTVAILFNLALCHHRLANNNTDTIDVERKSHLLKALAIYSLSCRIQLQEDMVLDDIHLLSHINNMGTIHKELGNTEMSRRCWSRLLSHLVLYRELAREREDQSVSDLRTIVEGFHGNVTHLLLRDASTAPSA